MDCTAAETDEFVEGFVKACFDNGFTEDQTADLLRNTQWIAMSENEEFRKGLEGELSKSAFWWRDRFSGNAANDYTPAYMQGWTGGGNSSSSSSKPKTDIYSMPKGLHGSAGSGSFTPYGSNSSYSGKAQYGPMHLLQKNRDAVKSIDEQVAALQKQQAQKNLNNPRGHLEHTELQREINRLAKQRDAYKKDVSRYGTWLRRDQARMHTDAARDLILANRHRYKADKTYKRWHDINTGATDTTSWFMPLQWLANKLFDGQQRMHSAVERGERYDQMRTKAQEGLTRNIYLDAYR